MSNDTHRLQQALAAAPTAEDPLAQVRALRQAQLAACAVRGGREIARLQQQARAAAATPADTDAAPAADHTPTPQSARTP
ncbi:MAG TPA: hypothetical protein PKA16_10370 [Ottowia sp.]|uniref:hypothetical protein n=1 Tax=Ottowia sp. TaxID=1898956 RepID=UPI002CC1F8E9|nr:hypothetical protein [Ottowia sp.]HMN21784.1 hypothetical protein [Ottowia sp.]